MLHRQSFVASATLLFIFAAKCYGDRGSIAETREYTARIVTDDDDDSGLIVSSETERALKPLLGFQGNCPKTSNCGPLSNRGTRIHRMRLGGRFCLQGCVIPGVSLAPYRKFTCGACPIAAKTTNRPTKAPANAPIVGNTSVSSNPSVITTTNGPTKAPANAAPIVGNLPVSSRPTTVPFGPPGAGPVSTPTLSPNGSQSKAPTAGTATAPSFHAQNSIPDKLSQADTVRAITAKNARHDPDGIDWIKRESWTPWDGKTTYNPCTLNKTQLLNGIFPVSIHTMRGLREVFYEIKPFANNSNPTVAEIENWNVEVIRHFRRLLGFNENTHPVKNDKCTYLKAGWAEERARTNHWSDKYPGTLNGAAGPCTVPYSPNAHCGASFLPNSSDQAPYLEGIPTCSETGGAEGILTTKTVPWAVLMGRVIGQFLWSDGIGAHTGPYVGRPRFGSAWYLSGGDSVVLRGKWSGALVPTCPR